MLNKAKICKVTHLLSNASFWLNKWLLSGYVTELLLTLEAAVDSLESDFRPLDLTKEIFKSTPNLNNKEAVSFKKNPDGTSAVATPVLNHSISGNFWGI